MSFFRLPTRVRIEPGCRALLPGVVRERGAERVLLVTDPGVAALSFATELVAAVRASGATCEVFEEVEANPRTTTTERIGRRARAEGVDLVVALGGGSVLDAAKAGAMLATNDGALTDYVGKNRFETEPLPLVALPTTCGTGSEVTWVAVVTDEASGTKVSVKGDAMFPDVALVDAELLTELPPPLLASTGMDALTHAIEAATGRLANPASDALASRAVFDLVHSLEPAVRDAAANTDARDAVAAAATIAGMAFGNSDVGAVHCLSETLGGLFDVPHGLANAVLLVPCLRHQLESTRPVLARFESLVARTEPNPDDAERFLARLEALGRAVGIPSFAGLAIPTDRYAEVAEAAVRNGSNDSCPQPMGATDYRAILEGLS